MIDYMTPEYRKEQAERFRLAADIIENDLSWEWRWEGSNEWKDGADRDIREFVFDSHDPNPESPHHTVYLFRIKP